MPDPGWTRGMAHWIPAFAGTTKVMQTAFLLLGIWDDSCLEIATSSFVKNQYIARTLPSVAFGLANLDPSRGLCLTVARYRVA